MDGTVIAQNARTGSIRWEIDCEDISGVRGCQDSVEAEFALSPDGTHLYYGDFRGTVVSLTVGTGVTSVSHAPLLAPTAFSSVSPTAVPSVPSSVNSSSSPSSTYHTSSMPSTQMNNITNSSVASSLSPSSNTKLSSLPSSTPSHYSSETPSGSPTVDHIPSESPSTTPTITPMSISMTKPSTHSSHQPFTAPSITSSSTHPFAESSPPLVSTNEDYEPRPRVGVVSGAVSGAENTSPPLLVHVIAGAVVGGVSAIIAGFVAFRMYKMRAAAGNGEGEI